jgi:hypothetical protein
VPRLGREKKESSLVGVGLEEAKRLLKKRGKEFQRPLGFTRALVRFFLCVGGGGLS